MHLDETWPQTGHSIRINQKTQWVKDHEINTDRAAYGGGAYIYKQTITHKYQWATKWEKTSVFGFLGNERMEKIESDD